MVKPLRRTNNFRIKWADPGQAKSEGIGCATLWNKLNYRRRQSFFDEANDNNIDWSWNDLYDDFKEWIGSSVAQQIVRKNQYAWNSYFALLRLKTAGKLPPEIERVCPPGYWKDRNTGLKNLIILVRNDLYSINDHDLKIPKKINPLSKVNGTCKFQKEFSFAVLTGFPLEILCENGKPRWSGKQSELECIYDRTRKRWYAHQPVRVELNSTHRPSESKKAFVDLGIVCPVTAVLDEDQQPIAFNGRPIKSDWLYWAREIDKQISLLKKTNDKDGSRKVNRLYLKRKRRYRHALNTIIHRFVKHCAGQGITEIITGELTGILRDDGDSSTEMNKQRHNLWSFRYALDRLKMTAENFGIKVDTIDEAWTSSVCPGCGSTNMEKHKRLLKCLGECKKEWHRDVAGAINLSTVHSGKRLSSLSYGECDNRVMAHPLFIPHDGAKTS